MSNNTTKKIKLIHESSWWMIIPLLILSYGSIFVGYLCKDLFVGLGVDTWNGTFDQLSNHISFFQSEFLVWYIKLIPVLFSFSGFLISILIYLYFKSFLANINNYVKFYYLYKFLSKKWYFDEIYNGYIVNYIFFFGYKISFKIIDRGFIEIFGPLGLTRYLNFISIKFSNYQSGLIYHYILPIFLGLIFISFQITNGFSLPELIVIFIILKITIHLQKTNLFKNINKVVTNKNNIYKN
jgi:NADH-ubiquinone oxidoreductase chain 5